MSEWLDNQQKPNGTFRKLLQERVEKSNPRRESTVEEQSWQTKLQTIAEKLKRRENMQNCQLQISLIEDGYAQIEIEW